jgi:putative transposase
MKRIKFSEQQVLGILKAVDRGWSKVGRGLSGERDSGIDVFNWWAKYGGMTASDIKRLRELEKENRRLKRMYAGLALQNRVLKDLIEKKHW